MTRHSEKSPKMPKKVPADNTEIVFGILAGGAAGFAVTKWVDMRAAKAQKLRYEQKQLKLQQQLRTQKLVYESSASIASSINNNNAQYHDNRSRTGQSSSSYSSAPSHEHQNHAQHPMSGPRLPAPHPESRTHENVQHYLNNLQDKATSHWPKQWGGATNQQWQPHLPLEPMNQHHSSRHAATNVFAGHPSSYPNSHPASCGYSPLCSYNSGFR